MASGKKIKTWLTKPVVVHCGYGVIIACFMTYFITKCSNDSKLNQEKTMEIINNLQKIEDCIDSLNARTFEDSITSLTAQLQECEKKNDSLNEVFKKASDPAQAQPKPKKQQQKPAQAQPKPKKQQQKPAQADTIVRSLEEEKIDIQITNDSENKGDIRVENASGYNININIEGSTNSGDITIVSDCGKDSDKAKLKTDNNVVHCIYERKSIEKYVVYRSKGNSY